MADRQILRNECEQAMLQLENAFLKYMGTSKYIFVVSSIASRLYLDTALGRAVALRLSRKKVVELKFGSRWTMRRKDTSR